jgi:aspartyl aminopeptidase
MLLIVALVIAMFVVSSRSLNILTTRGGSTGIGLGNHRSKLAATISMSSSSSNSYPRRLPTVADQKSPELKIEESDRIKRCIQFLDSSPEPFHCVNTVITRLAAAGFTRLEEGSLWRESKSILRGGKYYFTRNGSTIVAFTVGQLFKSGASGFKVIGAHTDSPNLKLKPRSKKSANGLVQLSVEAYGGGLWHTWFDRDLSIAGRVIVRTLDSTGSATFAHRFIKVDRPVLRVPNLCIHLRTPDERDAFKVNKEDHLIPILCDHVEKTMGTGPAVKTEVSKEEATDVEADQWTTEQQPELLSLLSEELQCAPSDIVDFELSLYDTQGAAVSGYRQEFLCGSRIDNLASCFVAVEALVTHAASALEGDDDVSMIALFDHEEVGSGSNPGAGSTIMRDAVTRISNALDGVGGTDSELFKAELAR